MLLNLITLGLFITHNINSMITINELTRYYRPNVTLPGGLSCADTARYIWIYKAWRHRCEPSKQQQHQRYKRSPHILYQADCYFLKYCVLTCKIKKEYGLVQGRPRPTFCWQGPKSDAKNLVGYKIIDLNSVLSLKANTNFHFLSV
jgi:hypothetical protein